MTQSAHHIDGVQKRTSEKDDLKSWPAWNMEVKDEARLRGTRKGRAATRNLGALALVRQMPPHPSSFRSSLTHSLFQQRRGIEDGQPGLETRRDT